MAPQPGQRKRSLSPSRPCHGSAFRSMPLISQRTWRRPPPHSEVDDLPVARAALDRLEYGSPTLPQTSLPSP